ncbi:MAG: exopolysaccharide transport family protein, partial [Candidatus Eiseniibacteriota bacterium]
MIQHNGPHMPSSSALVPTRGAGAPVVGAPATHVAEPSSPHRVLEALRRRWRVILLGILSVVAAVAGLTFIWPESYESSALLLVEQRLTGNDGTALAVLERFGQASRLETEIEILKSRPVVEQVVDELDLHVTATMGERTVRPFAVFDLFDAGPAAAAGRYQVKTDGDGSGLAWSTASGNTLARGAASDELRFAGIRASLDEEFKGLVELDIEPFEETVDATRERIRVTRPQRDAALIRVTGTGRTAEAAHALCDAVLRSYMSLRTELQRTEASATSGFLRDQVARVGKQLEEAERRLEVFSRDNQIVALEERAQEEVRQHTRLKEQRDQLEAERSALAAVLERTGADGSRSDRWRNLASFPTMLSNQAIAELLRSLVELENRRSDLARTRSSRNRDVTALDDRISEVENELRSIVVSYEASLADQIRSLDATIASSKDNLSEIPAQQVETGRLEREAALLGDLHRMLETRLREAEVAQAVIMPGVRIVGAASTPFEPSSPSWPRNLAVGFALGLVYGLALAAYREFRDTRIRERHEVERETGLTVLSMVPRLRRAGALLPVSSDRVSDGEVVAAGAPSRDQYQEVAFEAFRGISAALSFAERTLDLDHVCSVAIASTARNEGKTFTACNLALTRARSHTRTLLVDADLRGNGVARFFGLPDNHHGLCEVLA